MHLVTAIVLSLNRQDFLRSQLLYYADKPVHLVLADGSNNDWGSGESGKIGQMSWEYFRMSGPNTYRLRAIEGARRAGTKYVYLLDDEDCILWTGMAQAIEFLQSNPLYVSAGGQTAFATHISKRIGLVASPAFNNWEISHPVTETRLAELLRQDRRPAYLYYHLHTTQNLLALLQQIVKLPTDIPGDRTAKYIPIFMALVGLWKVDTNPFLVRRQFLRSQIEAFESPENKSFTEVDSRKIAETLYMAMVKLAEQNHQVNPPDFIESITRVIHGRYKILRIPGEIHHTTWRQLFSKSFLFALFNHFPRVYRLMRPKGLKTVSDYAKFSIDSTGNVLRDLEFLERLWISHPNGVAVNELELLLNH